MRKRYMIVPMDKDTMKALDFDEAKEKQLISLELDDKQFSYLFENGIFDLMNSIADVVIDDFEDDEITNKKSIIKIINVLKEMKNIELDINKKQLIDNVLNLFIEAFNRDTGIFFYF